MAPAQILDAVIDRQLPIDPAMRLTEVAVSQGDRGDVALMLKMGIQAFLDKRPPVWRNG